MKQLWGKKFKFFFSHVGFRIALKTTTLLVDFTGTFLVPLLISHAVVLEKKLKLSQPIRGNGMSSWISNSFNKIQHCFRNLEEQL
jgi:hypothetical protein